MFIINYAINGNMIVFSQLSASGYSIALTCTGKDAKLSYKRGWICYFWFPFFSPGQQGTMLNCVSAEQTEPPWKQKVFIPRGVEFVDVIKVFKSRCYPKRSQPDAVDAMGI